MDGRTLLTYGMEDLGGIAPEDRWFFFECLDKAAEDFVRETQILKDTATITLEAGRQVYPLPHDFITVYAKAPRSDRYIARYTAVDGSTSLLVLTSDENIFLRNKIQQEVPRAFAILDPADPGDPQTAIATAADVPVGGECVLTDTGSDFTVQGVSPRWRIQNINDGSHGIVLSVTSPTQLRTALFDGEGNDWDVDDTYVLTPVPVKRLQLENPPPEDGATINLPYLCLPAPVFSEIGRWRIPRKSARAICREASYLFNFDFDHDPKLDADLHGDFLAEISREKTEIAKRRQRPLIITSRLSAHQ